MNFTAINGDNLQNFKNARLGAGVALFFGYLIHFIFISLIKV